MRPLTPQPNGSGDPDIAADSIIGPLAHPAFQD